MIPEKVLQFGAALCHNVEKIARDGTAIASRQEPDFAADRTWDAFLPGVAQLIRLAAKFPAREDLLLPDGHCLFKAALLGKPDHALLLKLLLFLAFSLQIAYRVFTRHPVSLV